MTILSARQHDNDLNGARELIAEAELEYEKVVASNGNCYARDAARHGVWEANQLLRSIESIEMSGVVFM
jgi:hydrogenase maturation factor